jgi:hypothetical protein
MEKTAVSAIFISLSLENYLDMVPFFCSPGG